MLYLHFMDECLCSSQMVLVVRKRNPNRLAKVKKGIWAHMLESSEVAGFSPQLNGQTSPLLTVLALSPDKL